MREAHSIGVKKELMVRMNRNKTRMTKSKTMIVLQEGEELGRNLSMQGSYRPC